MPIQEPESRKILVDRNEDGDLRRNFSAVRSAGSERRRAQDLDGTGLHGGIPDPVEVDRDRRAAFGSGFAGKLVWLVDVAGLTRDDAAELMLSSSRALVRAALSDAVSGS